VSPKNKIHRSIKAWYESLSIEAQRYLSHWDICALKDQVLEATTDHEAEHRRVAKAHAERVAAREAEPDDSWIIRNHAGEPEIEPEPEPEPKTKKLGSTQKLLLRSMKLRTVYRTSEAAKLIDTSANTTSKSLSGLVKRGFVKKVRHGYWRKVKSL